MAHWRGGNQLRTPGQKELIVKFTRAGCCLGGLLSPMHYDGALMRASSTPSIVAATRPTRRTTEQRRPPSLAARLR